MKRNERERGGERDTGKTKSNLPVSSHCYAIAEGTKSIKKTKEEQKRGASGGRGNFMLAASWIRAKGIVG